MARSNWSAEDPARTAQRNTDRAGRQAKAKQMDRAGHAAGRGQRSI